MINQQGGALVERLENLLVDARKAAVVVHQAQQNHTKKELQVFATNNGIDPFQQNEQMNTPTIIMSANINNPVCISTLLTLVLLLSHLMLCPPPMQELLCTEIERLFKVHRCVLDIDWAGLC